MGYSNGTAAAVIALLVLGQHVFRRFAGNGLARAVVVDDVAHLDAGKGDNRYGEHQCGSQSSTEHFVGCEAIAIGWRVSTAIVASCAAFQFVRGAACTDVPPIENPNMGGTAG